MKEVDSRVRDICKYQIYPNYVLEKLAELGERSRRNNLRIDGINEEKGKKHGRCAKQKLKIFFRRN